MPTPVGAERQEDRGTDTVTASDIDKKRDAARLNSAASIRPGCAQWVMASWKPKESKPMKQHLLDEMARRLPRSKCKTWDAQKLADLLHETEPKVINAF